MTKTARSENKMMLPPGNSKSRFPGRAVGSSAKGKRHLLGRVERKDSERPDVKTCGQGGSVARGTTARSPPHKVQARRFGAWARGVKGERGRRLTLGNTEPRGPSDTFRQSGDPGVPLNKRGAIRGTLWDPGRCVPVSGRPRWWLGRGIVAKGAFPRSKAAGGGLGGLSRPMHRRLRSILGVGVDRPDAAGGAAPATPAHAHPRTRRPPCSPALRSPICLFVCLF